MRFARFALRPATPADRPFVEFVYFETQRWLIEELFGWRGEEFERAKFDEFYDQEHTHIVRVDDGEVGWITVVREPGGIELDSIYITPAMQGRGIGTALLEGLIAEAEAESKPVTLGTAKINPARRLYERLGFKTIDEGEFKVYMKRSPS